MALARTSSPYCAPHTGGQRLGAPRLRIASGCFLEVSPHERVKQGKTQGLLHILEKKCWNACLNYFAWLPVGAVGYWGLY